MKAQMAWWLCLTTIWETQVQIPGLLWKSTGLLWGSHTLSVQLTSQGFCKDKMGNMLQTALDLNRAERCSISEANKYEN